MLFIIHERPSAPTPAWTRLDRGALELTLDWRSGQLVRAHQRSPRTAEPRKRHGSRNSEVFELVGDSPRVCVLIDWESREAFERWPACRLIWPSDHARRQLEAAFRSWLRGQNRPLDAYEKLHLGRLWRGGAER